MSRECNLVVVFVQNAFGIPKPNKVEETGSQHRYFYTKHKIQPFYPHDGLRIAQERLTEH